MRWCLYTVYQLNKLLSINENEIDKFCLIDFSVLSVNFSHVCIIYVKIKAGTQGEKNQKWLPGKQQSLL